MGYLGFASFMAFSSSLCHSSLALKIDHFGQKLPFPVRSGAELCKQGNLRKRVNLSRDWSFMGGSRVIVKPQVVRFFLCGKGSGVYASWLSGSQLASNVFTLGTAAVLPCYTLMVVAPKSELCRLTSQWKVAYRMFFLAFYMHIYSTFLGPETIQLLFASKYLLPELTSIGKMFSSEMTLASAWIHLLVVDLFAARQVFHDGLENEIETRHSVSLCLLFCPIGVLAHVITKEMTKKNTRKE